MFNFISSNALNKQNLFLQGNMNQGRAQQNGQGRGRGNAGQGIQQAKSLPMNPHAANNLMFNFLSQMMDMLAQIAQKLSNYKGCEQSCIEPPKNEPPKNEPPKYEPPKNEPPKEEPPKYEPPKNEPPKEEPPKYEPPVYEPPVEEPPVYEPPTYEPPKILGSAGLFGDPQFGLFSPNLGNIPSQLQAFDSGIQTNEVVSLLNDPDHGGLEVQVKGIQVNPLNANSTGVGEIRLQSGSDSILINNDGDLLVNNELKGNINDDGFIAPISLSNGATISTGLEIDGAGGVQAERFVFTNGDYKITAALRSPHANANNYFDMNFEEKKKDAADNAHGYQVAVQGLSNPFGIVDLLRLEPDDLQNIA